MTWDTVDAVFGLALIALGVGAVACVHVIAREYQTQRMDPAWLDRQRRREPLTADYREHVTDLPGRDLPWDYSEG
jgi:hypothetical protein